MTGDVSQIYGLANVDALSVKRQRTLPVNCRVYDLLNFASELATHHATGSGSRTLQGWIGTLVSREYDLENSCAAFDDFRDFFLDRKLTGEVAMDLQRLGFVGRESDTRHRVVLCRVGCVFFSSLFLPEDYFMFSKGSPQSSLMAEITRDCEYLLVEAAIGFAKDREWSVRGYLGGRSTGWLWSWMSGRMGAVIEIRDAASGEAVKRIEITIMCWPKRER